MRSLVKAILRYDLDAMDIDADGSETPSTTELDAGIERATKLMGRRLFFYGPITLTLASGIAIYSLDGAAFAKQMLGIDQVHVGSAFLRDYYSEPGLFTAEQLTARYPTWPSAASGTPIAAAQMGHQLLLHPKPNTNGSATAVGQYMPASFSEIPSYLHEQLAQLAAAYLSLPHLTEEEQWLRYKTLNEDGAGAIEELGARMREATMRRAA